MLIVYDITMIDVSKFIEYTIILLLNTYYRKTQA